MHHDAFWRLQELPKPSRRFSELGGSLQKLSKSVSGASKIIENLNPGTRIP
jgi:hypothetical protein